MSDKNDNQGNMFSGDIDPDIAELMGIGTTASSPSPAYSDLFGANGRSVEQSPPEEIDLSKKHFTQISKFEEAPKPFFKNQNFYKTAISDTGEAAQRFHKYLSDYLNTQDPKERTLYRGKLISAYWNVLEQIAMHAYDDLPMPKQLMLRFGVVLPTLISAEQQDIISRIVFNNEWDEPVHYVDEWLKKIATGQIANSATDETKPTKRKEEHKILSKVDQTRGQRDFQVGVIQRKTEEMISIERLLLRSCEQLSVHANRSDFPQLKRSYSADQQRALQDCLNYVRELGNIDRDLGREWRKLEDLQHSFLSFQDKADDFGVTATVDNDALHVEFNTVRQMSKLCVGRQGNHMPVLIKNYFRANMREIGTRENLIAQMAQIENLDPELFLRTFKRETNRIVPHVIIIPCYGEKGVCWEPFERFNRATSRGRIAIPMFPKDLRIAVIAALADLRWQVAKEKAQHYWMEEGLTGRYYQWFTEKKMKGDVREYFINDYILWITKESEGTQKLDRDVRSVFWRYVPFPEQLRETLKNRGYVYNELFKKDINRSMSDGY